MVGGLAVYMIQKTCLNHFPHMLVNNSCHFVIEGFHSMSIISLREDTANRKTILVSLVFEFFMDIFATSFNYYTYLCHGSLKKEPMTVISAKEFNARQNHFMRMARRGEHVMVRSRGGNYHITFEPSIPASSQADGARVGI